MKRVRLSTIIISIVIVGGALAAAYWPRPAGGELYRHYEGRSDIKASYFKDYKINDSVAVDVTLLAATTNDGWDTLKNNFNIPNVPKEYEHILYGDSNNVSVKLAPKNNPALPIDSIPQNNYVVAISFYRREICVFMTNTEEQLKAVSFLKYSESCKNETKLE